MSCTKRSNWSRLARLAVGPPSASAYQTWRYRRGQHSRLYIFSPGMDIGGSGYPTAPTSAYAPYWHLVYLNAVRRIGTTEVSHDIRHQDFRA
jgi:hypothetical protein